jgi:hypothetical protein
LQVGIYGNDLRRNFCCLERERNEQHYQTFEGEENVESTNENEHSGVAIEVIETSNVS